MRATAFVVLAGLLAGCTSTMLLEPRITLSPYYAIYQLRGDMSVQTDPGGGAPLQNNPRQPLHVFGMDQHENDVGFRAEVGDGFGGLRVDYYRLEFGTSRKGILDADWGTLLEDDLVRSEARMDELRISYIEPLFETTTTWRDEDLQFRFGAGGEFVYRDMTFSAFTDDLMRRQNVPIEGQNLGINARFRAKWTDIAFDVDYSISPHFVIDGDLDGLNQDLEFRASYAIPLRDFTFFAGYRYSRLNVGGKVGEAEYAGDLFIDGFQFGLTVSI